MSMPNIPNITPLIDIDREQALTMLMASIALEEMGLAHIINAESEKIQYVLSAKLPKPCSITELKEINQGVERVIREVMKLQMLLQEKLENVISLTPKPHKHDPDIPYCQPSCSPSPQPSCPPFNPKCKCKTKCIFTGCGEGCVSNESDFFYGGTATVESSICPAHKNVNAFSLKYSLYKEKACTATSALLLGIPKTIKIRCQNNTPNPTVDNPNVLKAQGRGVMAIKGAEWKLIQCIVTFILTIWDYGCSKDFQMVTRTGNSEFNHDSGIVSVKSGNLAIKTIAETIECGTAPDED
jgi:hypothetical protein